MKKSLLLLIIPLASIFNTQCLADNWSDEDNERQWAYTVLHAVDWAQTHSIRNRADKFEINPILGKQPSKGEVNKYFAGTLIAHWVVAKALPPKWRKAFQYVTISMERGIIDHNIRAGIRINF